MAKLSPVVMSFTVECDDENAAKVNQVTHDLYEVFEAMLKLHLRGIAQTPGSEWHAAWPKGR